MLWGGCNQFQCIIVWSNQMIKKEKEIRDELEKLVTKNPTDKVFYLMIGLRHALRWVLSPETVDTPKKFLDDAVTRLEIRKERYD
jgi:hypothetical protein